MRVLYFIIGLLLPLSVFILPLVRGVAVSAELALFFVTAVIAGLIPAVDSRRPHSNFHVLDPLALWALFSGILGILYLIDLPELLKPMESTGHLDIREFRKIYWEQVIPYAIVIQLLVTLVVTLGLAIGVRRRRFIIRKAAPHEDMTLRLSEVRENVNRPAPLSDFLYRRLLRKSLVFIGERCDIIHYSIGAITLSHRDAILFFDFLDAEEDQSRWPRSISSEQFLHNLWQTPAFRGKSLYYIARPGDEFTAYLSKSDVTRPLADEESADLLSEINARYELVDARSPYAADVPPAFEEASRVLELLPSTENRDRGVL